MVPSLTVRSLSTPDLWCWYPSLQKAEWFWSGNFDSRQKRSCWKRLPERWSGVKTRNRLRDGNCAKRLDTAPEN